jgi:hypothetical protein
VITVEMIRGLDDLMITVVSYMHPPTRTKSTFCFSCFLREQWTTSKATVREQVSLTPFEGVWAGYHTSRLQKH